MKTKAVILYGVLTLLLGRLTDGQTPTFTEVPVNTAALVGTQTTFNCAVANLGTDHVAWNYFNATTSGQVRIYQSNEAGVKPGYTDRYSVDTSVAGQYNLVIKSVDHIVASKYSCEILLLGNQQYASLVALDEPICEDSGQEVDEGTEIYVPCDVVYYSVTAGVGDDSVLIPMLGWSADDNETVIVETSISNSTHVRTIMNVTLEARHDEMNFTCGLSFAGTNAPDYTSSCQTFYYVQYLVNEISVDPPINDSEEVSVGTELICKANGRPAPTIFWLDSYVNATESDNASLFVDESMVGQGALTFICQATNEFGNNSHTMELSVTFIAVDASLQPVKSGGTETWVIVVAVVVPVVVLLIAGVAGFFIYRHHQKKKNKAEKSKKSNGTTTATTAASASVRMSAYQPSSTVEPVENQPFLYTANPPPAPGPRPYNGGVSYQPNGRPGSTSGFADLSGQGAPQQPTTNGLGGSQYGGSTSRIVTPTPMGYPYSGPTAAVGRSPGPAAGSAIVGGRGTPALTVDQLPPATGIYAGSTGRLTPATGVNMSANPVAYPYAGPSRQMSNASSTTGSRASSHYGGGSQHGGPGAAPLSYPPRRPESSHNSSLV